MVHALSSLHVKVAQITRGIMCIYICISFSSLGVGAGLTIPRRKQETC